ncbi:MAG: hypothetical protein PHO64_02135 [Thiomonas sp.]|nr:hypothetical protein [Thiomonas sp.]
MTTQSLLRRIMIWLSAGIALSTMLAFAFAQAQTANVLQEDFTGAAPNLNWHSFGGACLTAGSATNSGPSGASNTGIPACLGDSYYAMGVLSYGATPTTPAQTQTGLTNNQDAPGQGALRLTNGCATVGGTNVCYLQQAGAIILDQTYPSNQGIRVTFTTYTYGGDGSGGHGADGIGFYILNGTATPNVGAWGGSLGYSCSNTNYPYDGMSGAYLGLGMDEFGNFLNQGDNTGTGINPTSSPNQQNPGEIGIRGYGNINLAALNAIKGGATAADVRSTCKNGGSYGGKTLPDYQLVPPGPNGYPTGLAIANESATTRTAATPITYTLEITPNGLLSLWYKYNATNTVSGFGTPVLTNVSIADPALYGPMPSTFRFGFGASTGGSDNVHEITCFQVVPATQAVTSPVAPVSISGGSYIYSLSSDPNPIAGHVQAYQTVATPTSSASAPLGTASGNPVWDAGDATHMSGSTRATSLYSTSTTPTGGQTGSGSQKLITALDSAAFGTWTTSTCLPSGSTGIGIIQSYTIDPNYTNGTCSYLAGRKAGWMLGGMSSNDAAAFLGAPGNANLLNLPGYVAFARANSSREKAVLFTSNDGFLYAVDATSGNLIWGWMPRPFVASLGNAPGLVGALCGNPNTNGACFDGQFVTADAVNTTTAPTASNWSTYVVGTAAGGAYHYALQLATNTSGAPMPSKQTWGISVTNGSSPQEQAPVIATINGQQYAVFTVNTTTTTRGTTTTTSKLYEVNVATGANSAFSATLPFIANSSITYVPSTGTLWMGDTKGGVWSLNVSGSASTDASGSVKVAAMTPADPVNFVGYTEIGGLPYIWAASKKEIEAFSLSGANSQPIWASAGGSSPSGYLPNNSGGLASNTAVMALQVNGEISAAPALINGVLVVPVYVPPTGTCGETGTGYYDLFDLVSGGLPKIPITYKNNAVTNGVISLGLGIPYTPSYTVTASGTLVYPGNSQPPSPAQGINPIEFGGSVMNKPIAWRQY